MINTMMMMIIMTLLGSSLLKAGVKDMGDLATLDSQSIRPIHPNLLFQSPNEDHAEDEDGVGDDEDGEEELLPLCESIGPNLLFRLVGRMLSIPFVQGGNNTNRKV